MKNLIVILATSTILFSSTGHNLSTSAVTLVGGIIKSTHIEPSDKKYKRKDCPVCKGTGKYLSGDQIKMVDCGYCELEKTEQLVSPPTTNLKIKCNGPNCKL